MMPSDQSLPARPATELVEVVPAQEPQAQKPANPLLVVHGLLRGRYPLAIALAILGGLIGAPLGYFALKPDYKSTGLIKFDPIVTPLLFTTPENGMMPMFESFLGSQVAVVQGRRVIDGAMLHPEWKAFGRGLLPSEVARFQESLAVTNPRGSQLIYVSFADRDPRAAAAAVKAVIETYREVYSEGVTVEDAERLRRLETYQRDLTQKRAAVENRIQEIAGQLDPSALEKLHDAKFQYFIEVDTELERARFRERMASRLQGDGKGDDPATQPAEVQFARLLESDQWIQELRRERAGIDRETRGMTLKFGDGHAKVVELRTRMAILDEDIQARTKELREMFDAAIGAGPSGAAPGARESLARSSLEELTTHHQELQSEIYTLVTKINDIRKARGEGEILAEQIAQTKTRIEQMQVEKPVGGRLSVLSFGDVPFTPDKDRRKALTAVGGLGMAGLGVGVVLLMGFLDRRLRHVDTTRSRLHQIDRLLGVLPEMPGDLIDPENAAETAFCVHHIRAMLQIRQRARGHKVLGITSPAPGDGKTSLAITLGMSLAASGTRTLVVDCDFDGGGLSSRLRRATRKHLKYNGQSPNGGNGSHPPDEPKPGETGDVAPGVYGVLKGEPLEAAITPSGYPNLSLLPLGIKPGAHAVQLAPETLRRLFDRLAALFDTVLIDTGPILGSVEAAVVAAEVDAMILVISRGGDRTEAERAANMLTSAGAEIEGIVFNRALSSDVEKSVYRSSRSGRSSYRSTAAETVAASHSD